MNNLDPAEIDKFNALAKTWWDPNGDMKPLHDINPLRLQFIQDKVALQNKTVIDVGCGGGILSEALAKAGATVTGVDMSEDLIRVATHHAEAQSLNITYTLSPIDAVSQQNPHQFDIVTCMEMLEHVPDPEAIVQACAQLTKPGGLLFFSTINRNVKAFLKTIVGAEYLLNMLPKGTHHYDKFIRPSELSTFAMHAGLSFTTMKGMDYNLFKKTFFLSDNVDANYLIAFHKPE